MDELAVCFVKVARKSEKFAGKGDDKIMPWQKLQNEAET